MTQVAIASLPMGGRIHPVMEAPEGMTVAEVVAMALDRIPDLRPFAGQLAVRVSLPGGGEHGVDRSLWRVTRLKRYSDRKVALSIGVTLHGGGNQLFATIIQVVAIVAAIAVQFVLPVGGQFVGAAILVAANIATALLAKGQAPPPVKPPQQQGQQGTAALQGNVQQQNGVISSVPGTMRVFPPILVKPQRTIRGDDETVTAVFGLAGWHDLSDIRLGDIPVSEMENVEIETRPGRTDDPMLTFVTRQSHSVQINQGLSRHVMSKSSSDDLKDQVTPSNSVPKWHRFAGRKDADEISLTMAFAGLYYPADAGNVIQTAFRFRIRQVGQAAWINLPESHIRGKRATPFRKRVRLVWSTAPASASAAAPFNAEAWGPCYYENIAQSFSPPFDQWVADTYFATGGTIIDVQNVHTGEDDLIFYLDPATFPIGTYEIEVRQGQLFDESRFSSVAYTYDPPGPDLAAVYDLFEFATGTKGVAGLQETMDIQGDYVGPVTITEVTSWWDEYPLQHPNRLALIALRATNVSVESLSVLASKYVQDWNGSDWANPVITKNPVPHFVDILTGHHNRRPVRLSQLDNDSLVDWRNRTFAAGLECSAVLDGGSVFDNLRLIAAAGNALPRQSEKWGVVMERDRSGDVPSQIFTPRDYATHTFEKDFESLPHGLRVSFYNEDENYRESQVYVYRDGYDSSNATLIEAIRYESITNQTQAETRALLDLRQAEFRAMFHTIEIDLMHLASTRGDLVGFVPASFATRYGSARILEIRTSGGNLTGLRLDEKVNVDTETDVFDQSNVFDVSDMWSLGAQASIVIRMSDRTLLTAQISNATGFVDEVTLSSPVALPSGLKIGNVVTIGKLGDEYMRMYVNRIKPTKARRAHLVLVDEAPEIHA